jgi:putative ABC transport system permease protein
MRHYWYVATTALGLAVDSLLAHKLRSFLTLLGIIIGVASVVVVGAAIEGLGVFAEKTTSSAFGSNSFLVAQIASVGRLDRREEAEKRRRNKQLRMEDVAYLRAVTGDVILYSPYRQRPDDVKRGDQTYEGAMVLGVSSTLAEMRDLGLAGGRFFTDIEERTGQRVAVIGDEVRRTLFPNSAALGGTVKLRGLDFEVIGYQEKLGAMGPQSQDNSFYIPITVFDRIYGTGRSIAIFGMPRPESGLSLEEALDLARVALRSRFHARPGQQDNFDTLTPEAIRSFVDNILGLIRVVVVPVTLISLVVGGIVIMNIMLVSVTERTLEIGIRKAIGARRSDILLQFLIEAVLLAMLGGAIGLGLGAALSQILSALLEQELKITAGYVVLALVVSSVVGIFSGWYPAARASKLDPVAALRAE